MAGFAGAACPPLALDNCDNIWLAPGLFRYALHGAFQAWDLNRADTRIDYRHCTMDRSTPGVALGWLIVPLAIVSVLFGVAALTGVWWGIQREENDF